MANLLLTVVPAIIPMVMELRIGHVEQFELTVFYSL
eukprot:gene34680-42774_t